MNKTCHLCEFVTQQCFLTVKSLDKFRKENNNPQHMPGYDRYCEQLKGGELVTLYWCKERENYFSSPYNGCDKISVIAFEPDRGYDCFDCLQNKTKTIRDIETLEEFFTRFPVVRNKAVLLKAFRNDGYVTVYWCAEIPAKIYLVPRSSKRVECATRVTD